MVDWKNIGVPIIVAIIAGAVSLVSALVNFIISALFMPNIQISDEPLKIGDNKVTIDITNNGTAAAKNLKLTVKAPPNTSFNRPFFSTEKYIDNATGNPTKLEMYVPRFVQGAGSLIKIESSLSPANVSGNHIVYSGNYIVYVTYDQGSIEKVIPLSLIIEAKPLVPIIISQYGITIVSVIVGIASISFAVWFHKKLTTIKIIEVRPDILLPHQKDNLITILGSNFGNKGTVWLEYYPPVTENEKGKELAGDDEFQYRSSRRQEQFDVTRNASRDENKIVIRLDDIMDILKHMKYVIRVEKNGSVTPANSKAAFRIFWPSNAFIQFDPPHRSTGIPIYSSITAKSVGPMRISTDVTTSDFRLHDSNNVKVDGIVSSDGIKTTFKPKSPLSYNTTYTAIINTTMTDEDGKSVPFASIWSFTTQSQAIM